jgi:hypothetical protein
MPSGSAPSPRRHCPRMRPRAHDRPPPPRRRYRRGRCRQAAPRDDRRQERRAGRRRPECGRPCLGQVPHLAHFGRGQLAADPRRGRQAPVRRLTNRGPDHSRGAGHRRRLRERPVQCAAPAWQGRPATYPATERVGSTLCANRGMKLDPYAWCGANVADSGAEPVSPPRLPSRAASGWNGSRLAARCHGGVAAAPPGGRGRKSGRSDGRPCGRAARPPPPR